AWFRPSGPDHQGSRPNPLDEPGPHTCFPSSRSYCSEILASRLQRLDGVLSVRASRPGSAAVTPEALLCRLGEGSPLQTLAVGPPARDAEARGRDVLTARDQIRHAQHEEPDTRDRSRRQAQHLESVAVATVMLGQIEGTVHVAGER